MSKPDEINPNHPVTRAISDHWHKVAALIMFITDKRRLIATPEMIDRMGREDLVIILHEHADSLEIRLMPREEGEKLAKEHGGMPV